MQHPSPICDGTHRFNGIQDQIPEDQLQLDSGRRIQTGTFGADMLITLANDGPVTIIIDSKQPE